MTTPKNPLSAKHLLLFYKILLTFASNVCVFHAKQENNQKHINL